MRRSLAVALLVLLALSGAAYATRWQYPAGNLLRVHRWTSRVERFAIDSGWREIRPPNPFQDLADEEKRLDSLRREH